MFRNAPEWLDGNGRGCNGLFTQGLAGREGNRRHGIGLGRGGLVWLDSSGSDGRD